jgi:hypothetical protein
VAKACCCGDSRAEDSTKAHMVVGNKVAVKWVAVKEHQVCAG